LDTLSITPSVIHDLIEGEIILLNIETGTYYQLKGEAVTVWQDIASGAPVPVLESNLGIRYGLSPQAAVESIQPFLLELQTENLVTVAPVMDAPNTPPPTPVSQPGEFKPPVLLKYTDMQSLLLLDPIHDVGTAGWPHKQNGVNA